MEYLRWAQPKQAQTIQLEQTLKILWLKNGRKKPRYPLHKKKFSNHHVLKINYPLPSGSNMK